MYTSTAYTADDSASRSVQVDQSFKTVGYGCTSCWGDVGAGDAEADVIYISFIVSVQYIGYEVPYRLKVQKDNVDNVNN